MKDYNITQTHPNKGVISINGIGYVFYTNNQVGPCIHSEQPTMYECESLINERTRSMIKFDSLESLIDTL